MPPFDENQEFDTIGTAQTELEKIDHKDFWQTSRYVFVKPNGKYAGITLMGFPYNHPVGWKPVCETIVRPNDNTKWVLYYSYEGDTGDFHELPVVGS